MQHPLQAKANNLTTTPCVASGVHDHVGMGRTCDTQRSDEEERPGVSNG